MKTEKIKKFIKTFKVKLSFIFILTIILIILACTTISAHFPKFIQKIQYENQILDFANKNKKSIFSIDEITLFSSADAKNKVGSTTNFTIENLYTYTDIAIFINQVSDEISLENTLKEVSIQNISFSKTPENGQIKLFYKNMNDFAKPYIPESNQITDEIKFNITSEENADLSTPTLYNNCANPITLSYIHENVKTDYTLTDTSIPITYSGSLLKRCNVPLSNITNTISFDIYITNNKDQKFKSKIFIPITYQSNDKTIYDGNITIKEKVNLIFYQYE